MIKKIIFTFIIVLAFSIQPAVAQRKVCKSADIAFERKQYNTAIERYKKALKKTNKKINTFSLISSIVAIAALIVASIPLFTKDSNEKLLEQLIKNQEKIIKQNEIIKTQFSLDSIRINQSKKIK